MISPRVTPNATRARLLLIWSVAVTALAATGAAQKSTAVEPVTSMAWLKDHLKYPAVVVIATDDTPPFDAGHIPRARFLGHDATLDHKGTPPEAGLRAGHRAGACRSD